MRKGLSIAASVASRQARVHEEAGGRDRRCDANTLRRLEDGILRFMPVEPEHGPTAAALARHPEVDDEDVGVATARLREIAPATLLSRDDLRSVLSSVADRRLDRLGLALARCASPIPESDVDERSAPSVRQVAQVCALLRRLCQLHESGGESMRSVRARHAEAAYAHLHRDLPEHHEEFAKCDRDPVGYLDAAQHGRMEGQRQRTVEEWLADPGAGTA